MYEIDLEKALERLSGHLQPLPDRLQAILREAAKITIDPATEKTLDSLHGKADPTTISKLKTEAVAELKTKKLNVFMKELHHVFRSHLTLAESAKGNAIGQCNAFTGLPTESGKPLQRMSDESRRREARDILRSKETAVKRGENEKPVNDRVEFLRKLIDADGSDSLLFLHCLQEMSAENLVQPGTLAELRESYTLKHRPELIIAADAAKLLYKSVRRQCAEFNSTVLEVLMEHGIDSPISLEEHFETFKPQTSRDLEMMGKRLLEDQRKKDAEARQLETDGLNFQASGLTLKQVRAQQ